MNKVLIVLFSISLGLGNLLNHQISFDESNIAEMKESTGDDIILGPFQKEDLMKKPYSKWFQPRYEKFKPNEEAMATIAENIKDYEIRLFMGTWCADSKREVPKFLKILDLANYDHKKLELIGVDYDKTTKSGIEKEFDIEYVPTIIFYKDGEEVNRFVEYPQESLEEDIAKIVSGEVYNNSYTN
ncbi:thioredoxin family protein [Gramella sp. GC03-9]|uniref:Thioredoxin family protein n=1 Tax=Christiangramia oceanisediminis TaxID=2920386 RepID=A0A9X2KUT0_9FLAO|nr:thioredoxin family protein [Gramella oceanisediminis]MCP9198432.1 thioredoxin family protein [Gramella oceanisediminis]